MKKALIPFLALFLVFGGCVRSSTLKRAINESESAKLQAASAVKSDKAHLEEIATFKKDIKDLRTRNEALVEKNLTKSEKIASLTAMIKGKTSENTELRRDLDALSSSSVSVKVKKKKSLRGNKTYRELFRALKEDIVMGSLSIIRGAKTLSLRLSEKALFESNKAGLLPEGKALLQRISSARDNLNSSARPVSIRPIVPSIKGNKKKAAEDLAMERGAVIKRFLNERADMKEMASNGMPYEEGETISLSGFAVELIFPYND